jgi:hypothetical protein
MSEWECVKQYRYPIHGWPLLFLTEIQTVSWCLHRTLFRWTWACQHNASVLCHHFVLFAQNQPISEWVSYECVCAMSEWVTFTSSINTPLTFFALVLPIIALKTCLFLACSGPSDVCFFCLDSSTACFFCFDSLLATGFFLSSNEMR